LSDLNEEQSSSRPFSWLFILPRFPHRLCFGSSLRTPRNHRGRIEPAIFNQAYRQDEWSQGEQGQPKFLELGWDQLSALIWLCQLFRSVVIVCPQSVACMSCLLTTDVADTNAIEPFPLNLDKNAAHA
jgi:hypothetical protein